MTITIYLLLLYNISIIICQILYNNENIIDDFDFEYPKQIESYHKRVDIYTNEFVQRGRIELLDKYINKYKKIKYKKFHRLLQCPKYESGFNGKRGSYDYYKLIKYNKNLLELCSLYFETNCNPWNDCINIRNKLNNSISSSIINDELTNKLTSPYQIRMIRIINGSFYYDWPYKRQRFDEILSHEAFAYMMIPSYQIIDMISDISDLVYFQGEEESLTNSMFPWPIITSSPNYKSNEIPRPWPYSYYNERKLYKLAFHPEIIPFGKTFHNNYIKSHGLNCASKSSTISLTDTLYNNDNCSFSDQVYSKYHSNNYTTWKFRNPKASFYGSITQNRILIYDLANLYPELLDVGWTTGIKDIQSTNPDGLNENIDYNNIDKEIKQYQYSNLSDINLNISNRLSNYSIGLIKPLLHFKIDNGIDMLERKYKYIVVLLGLNGRATADRLATVLGHSGSVVLLQTNEYEYHFSSRLKPWVHYVPISYNIADIIQKILWLRQHDRAAYKIAQNAKVFGESHLRLEDYYCYYASLYYNLGKLMNGSDALIPFDPKPVNRKSNTEANIDVY